jgi:nitrilase
VSDFPPDYPPFTREHHDKKEDGTDWEPEDILNHGGTCVVGPLGVLIQEPVFDKETIVYATLELSDLTEARVSIPMEPII